MKYEFKKVGQIVEGTVIKVEENTIWLDIQSQTEGKIHLDNFDKPAPETFIGLVKEGQKVKAKIQKITDDPAQILLSRLPILDEEKFDKIKDLAATGEPVFAKVKQVLDKGLVLNYLQYEVFLPYSLLDFELVKDKETLKGKTIEVQIVEATIKGRSIRIVASRKAIFEKERQVAYEQRQQARQDELDHINTGDVLDGIVDRIEAHAATVRFNHIVGLLRISQVSHHRIEKIEDILTQGQEVKVKVIKKEGNRLDLSMKALLKTPYELFYENNKMGSQVTGTVVQKLPFGLIIELEKDVRGLLHKNEFSWNPNDNYDTYVKIGDSITLSIIQLDKKKERISLSKKALADNPWKNVTLRRGEVVKAKVISMDREGLKVEVQGVEGTIAANELSNERITRIDDYFAVNDEVEAIITEIYKDQWILKLSIRRLLEQAERASFEQYLEDDSEQANVTIGDLFSKELKKTKKK
jgi:small subunit ribosomal protein S1